MNEESTLQNRRVFRYEGDAFWCQLPKEPITPESDVERLRVRRALFLALAVSLLLSFALGATIHKQLNNKGVEQCRQN